MNTLALVVGVAGVVVAGAAAARLLGFSDPLDWAIAALLLACAVVVLVSLAVGLPGGFERMPLLAGVAVVDAVLLAAAVRTSRPSVGLRVSLAVARRAAASLSAWQAVVVVAAALALAWRAVLAVVLSPFAYDSLTYHLTAVAAWIQTHHLGPNPYALCCGRYPSNTELLFAWPTVLLGRDTFTDLVQVGTALLGALAVVGLAREADLRPGAALTAGALFLLTPIVLTQANTNYNDVTLAALFLTGLYFATRYLSARCFAFGRRDAPPRVAFVVCSGAAAGIALGAKPNGIVLAAAVGAPILLQVALAAKRRRLRPRAAVLAAGTFLAATLVLGGWWYMRNWVSTGNPLAPFEVRALGVELLHGPATLHDYITAPPGGSRNAAVEIGRSWYHDLVFWTQSGYTYETRNGGLGPLWSWLGWLLLALAAVAALRRRRDLVVSVLLPAAFAFAVLPYRWWSRFTIYLAALGAVAVVAAVERLRPGWGRRALASLVVALALIGAVLAGYRIDPAGYGSRLTAGGVLELVAHPSRPRSTGDLFFHEYAWVDRVPGNAAIGVDYYAPSIRFLYPLFGSRLHRHVVLFLPGQEGSIAQRLARYRAAYLFVASGGAFDRWAQARPGAYRLVSVDRGTAAFERTAR